MSSLPETVQPILGTSLSRGIPSASGEPTPKKLPIYTRTIVLWAFNLVVDTEAFISNVILDPKGDKQEAPRVITVSTPEQRRGERRKRKTGTKTSPFRSVVSVDVEYQNATPNFKLSKRNTIQATGCQNMCAIGKILEHLVVTYMGKGFSKVHESEACGFVGDVVLANAHFETGFKVDLGRLRDLTNASTDSIGMMAIYEPDFGDSSVTIKTTFTEDRNRGFVYPRCTIGSGWDLLTYTEAAMAAPHANIHRNKRCHTFRVFKTGSVVQVGRWPFTMQRSHNLFCKYIYANRSTLGTTSGKNKVQTTLKNKRFKFAVQVV